MTVLAHQPLNIIMHSKTHLISSAAGLRPDSHGRTYSIRETTARSDRERVLKKWDKKRRWERIKGKRKAS